MPWFYDSRTGAYAEEAGILGFLSNLQAKLGLGWHQYATYADMTAAIAANHWPPLNTNPSNPIGKTAVGSAEAAGSATGVTGFLGDLTSRNLWIRVAKVVVGLGLLLAGVIQLTRAQGLIETAAKGAVLA